MNDKKITIEEVILKSKAWYDEIYNCWVNQSDGYSEGYLDAMMMSIDMAKEEECVREGEIADLLEAAREAYNLATQLFKDDEQEALEKMEKAIKSIEEQKGRLCATLEML